MNLFSYRIPVTVMQKNGTSVRPKTGIIESINEAAGTCVISFGDKHSRYHMKDVYLNEGALDKVKEFGSKLWDKIKGIARLAAGFIVPVTDAGKKLMQFFNIPVNLTGIELPANVYFAPSDSTLALAEANDINIVNNYTVEDAFATSMDQEAADAQKYWARVMQTYAANESFKVKDAVKFVNENYYKESKFFRKALNESKRAARRRALNEDGTISSLRNYGDIYGLEVSASELLQILKKNVRHQISGSLKDMQENPDQLKFKTHAPVIWGAPGIGKTSIIMTLATELKEQFDLNIIAIKCAGLLNDAFVLPASATNSIGLKTGYDTPKTWLPCYDKLWIKGDFDSWVALDEFYNSGSYSHIGAIDNLINQYAPGSQMKNNEGEGSSVKKGGILFFDEFTRMAEGAAFTNVMNLVSDRVYGTNLILASRWAVIAAANRMHDDGLPEMTKDETNKWVAAAKSRYMHLTFVPTKKEWLEWARRPNSKGYQNIDEYICKFIEQMKPKVWYDCLDFNSESLGQGAKQVLDIHTTDDITTTANNMTKDEQLAKHIAQVDKYVFAPTLRNKQLTTWNPRTWEYISDDLRSEIIDLIGADNYADVFYNNTITGTNTRGRSQQYNVKNIDFEALAEALDTISEDDWLDWAIPKFRQKYSERDILKTPRIKLFNEWIETKLLPQHTGPNSTVVKSFKDYLSYKTSMTESVLRNIWATGLKDAPGSDKTMEDLTCAPMVARIQFDNYPGCKWKKSEEDTLKVLTELSDFKFYKGGIDGFKNDLLQDLQLMRELLTANNGKVPTVPAADMKRIEEEFRLVLYAPKKNARSKKQKEVLNATIFPTNTLQKNIISPLDPNTLAFILNSSPAISSLCNVCKYIIQIMIQTGSNCDMSEEKSPIRQLLQLFFTWLMLHTNTVAETMFEDKTKQALLQEILVYFTSISFQVVGPVAYLDNMLARLSINYKLFKTTTDDNDEDE